MDEDELAGSEAERRRRASDEMLVEALASGLSYADAGVLGGVTARTVARRMADPEFAALVNRRRRDRVTAVSDRLTGLAETAMDTLLEVMVEGAPAQRLKAAETVLSMTLRFRYQHALGQEITELIDTPRQPPQGLSA